MKEIGGGGWGHRMQSHSSLTCKRLEQEELSSQILLPIAAIIHNRVFYFLHWTEVTEMLSIHIKVFTVMMGTISDHRD